MRRTRCGSHLHACWEPERGDVLDATADDYFTVLLTMQADIAQTYFSLRSFDAEIDVLRRAIDIRKQALDLIDVDFEPPQQSDTESPPPLENAPGNTAAQQE